MQIERDGVTFQVDTSHDGDDFWERYYLNGWEAEQAGVLDLVPRDGTFVDIGAWIGPWTLPAAARGLTVHAYEPDGVALDRLWANLALNTRTLIRQHNPVPFVHPKAVTVDGAPRILTAQGDIWGGSMSGRWAQGNTAATFASVPIGEVLDVADPFVKIDVEGDEFDLFPEVAAAGVPCHVSLHGPFAKVAGDPADFRARLEPSFRRYRQLFIDGRRPTKASAIPYDSFCSVTCLDPRR